MKYCGDCTNWRCDNPLILKGHCNFWGSIKFHDTTFAELCKEYQSKWEYTRPVMEGDKE